MLPVVAYGFGIPLWAYILGAVWLGQSLISVRTFAEHQWSERPDGRTIIIERSPLALLFLNNNLHLVHHKSPNVAWYRLPTLFRERREQWISMNNGYVFRAILRCSGICLQGQGAGGASGAAPRARDWPRLPSARQGQQRVRPRHRAGARRAAEGIAPLAVPPVSIA